MKQPYGKRRARPVFYGMKIERDEGQAVCPGGRNMTWIHRLRMLGYVAEEHGKSDELSTL